MKKFDYSCDKIHQHQRLSRRKGRVHQLNKRRAGKKRREYDVIDQQWYWQRRSILEYGLNDRVMEIHWCDHDINTRCYEATGLYPE